MAAAGRAAVRTQVAEGEGDAEGDGRGGDEDEGGGDGSLLVVFERSGVEPPLEDDGAGEGEEEGRLASLKSAFEPSLFCSLRY